MILLKSLTLKKCIMNLEKLNLVELNAQELKEIDGGFFLLFQNPIVIAFAVGMYNQYQSHKNK